MSDRFQLNVLETDALFEAVTRHVIGIAQQSLADRDSFAIALGGGSTPKRMFGLMASDFRDALDWSRVEFYWGDERSVPPDHADSNFGMARDLLLHPLGIEPARIHRMEGEREDLAAAAADYERVIRERVAVGSAGIPALDLVLLGMGDDAHTASLFPGSSALDESDRFVVANHVEKLDTDRLTMTYPLINAAKRVIFVVTGEGKADALVRVLEGPRNVQRNPSQGVCADVTEWWVDAGAGSKLTQA